MRRTRLVAASFAVLIALSAVTSAEAGRYGRTGLGSNLHRRFVLKQAYKNYRLGKPVRRSAIVWKVGPSAPFYRSTSGWRR